MLDPVKEYLIKSIEKKENENKLPPAKKEDADEHPIHYEDLESNQ